MSEAQAELKEVLASVDGVPFDKAIRWVRPSGNIRIRRKGWNPWLLVGQAMEYDDCDYVVRDHKSFTYARLSNEERLNNDWILIDKRTFLAFSLENGGNDDRCCKCRLA